jgi:Na+:H+ antiporter, NhaA family
MTSVETRSVDHTIGPADAPVTLIEYGDYQCPYCAKARPVLAELTERAGDALRFVFRHYPLDSVHPFARRIAEAAAGEGTGDPSGSVVAPRIWAVPWSLK